MTDTATLVSREFTTARDTPDAVAGLRQPKGVRATVILERSYAQGEWRRVHTGSLSSARALVNGLGDAPVPGRFRLIVELPTP